MLCSSVGNFVAEFIGTSKKTSLSLDIAEKYRYWQLSSLPVAVSCRLQFYDNYVCTLCAFRDFFSVRSELKFTLIYIIFISFNLIFVWM